VSFEFRAKDSYSEKIADMKGHGIPNEGTGGSKFQAEVPGITSFPADAERREERRLASVKLFRV